MIVKINSLDLFEEILYNSPQIIVVIIPFIIYQLFSINIFKRFHLSGKSIFPIFSLIMIISIIIQFISFYIREEFGFPAKKYALFLHETEVKSGLRRKISDANNFILLPNGNILFYATRYFSNDIPEKVNLVIDSLSTNQLITSKKAKFENNYLLLKEGYHYNTKNIDLKNLRQNYFDSFSFNPRNINLAKYIDNIENVFYIPTGTIIDLFLNQDVSSIKTKKYLVSIISDRLSPFVYFLIVIILVSIKINKNIQILTGNKTWLYSFSSFLLLATLLVLHSFLLEKFFFGGFHV